MKVRKVQKIKRAVMFSLALGVMALSVTVSSQASYNAIQKSARPVPADSHGASYWGEVCAQNKTYKKANEGESWFRAAMRRNDGADSELRSRKTFFKGQKTATANTPSASWPYKKCVVYMK